jgi:hypothetical protein
MTIGPVQLLVLGFDDPQFQGDLLYELDRLRDNDLVRLIDGLAVQKDEDGNLSLLRHSDLDIEEATDVGTVVGALVGLGAAFTDGFVPQENDDDDHGGFFSGDWDVLAEIPEGTAAALLLLEHRWAIPLRDAITRAGGSRLASEFINPLDLVAFGMVSAGEAQELVAAEGNVL